MSESGRASWTVSELSPRGPAARLRLAGDLDPASTSGLVELMSEANRPDEDLVLEVSGVGRLTAAGLRAVAREAHRRSVHGGSVTLEGLHLALQQQLARAGMLELAQAEGSALAAQPERASA